MTIYIPNLTELPRAQLSRLSPDADFSESQANGSVSAFAYEWPDLKVVINVTSGANLAGHLEGFVGYVRSVATAHGHPVDENLIRRIRATTLVLGFVVEGATDPDAWHDRVEDLIATICFNTGALLFWEGAIFDENCQQLLPVQ